MKQKVVAIIQARLSSTRLPGKVLKKMGSTTMLGQVVKRVRQAKLLDDVVVATSTDKKDGKIVDWCNQNKVTVFAGSLNDVLDRYYQTAKEHNVTVIVRVTADCPLIDPHVIDSVVQTFLDGDFDYVANNHPKATYPDGMDTEVFSLATLEKTWKEASLLSEREHVTPYIWKNPELFKLFNVVNVKDLSRFRLTVDEQADYKLLTEVLDYFKKSDQEMTMEEVVAFLENNEGLLKTNQHISRDEGYAKSLRTDKKIK